jgi:hypothetical protein
MMETEGWVSMLTETWPTVQHQTDIRLYCAYLKNVLLSSEIR